MKNMLVSNAAQEDDLRLEYDAPLLQEMLRSGVRGKYAVPGIAPAVTQEPDASPSVVTLEADVAAVFGSAAAVNEALRFLIKVARDATPDAAPVPGTEPTA